MFVASDTTNSFAETAICKCADVFMLSSALYIDSVKARSLVALGAMRATFRVVIPGWVVLPLGWVVLPLGWLVVVVVDELVLPHAATANAIPPARSTHMALLARCLYMLIPFLLEILIGQMRLLELQVKKRL